MNPRLTPDALLFDLGGVVIDIDFDRVFRKWEPISRLSFDEIKRTFWFDAQYEQHERGEITAQEYFDHLTELLQLEGSHPEILAGWNAIYIREIAETVDIIRVMRTRIPCYAFTNTNAAHQGAWKSMFPGVVSSFDHVFASHEIGFRKPERMAFEHIADVTDVALASILFFDDTPSNVEGARAAGLQAVQVHSPADVRNALQAAGYAV